MTKYGGPSVEIMEVTSDNSITPYSFQEAVTADHRTKFCSHLLATVKSLICMNYFQMEHQTISNQ